MTFCVWSIENSLYYPFIALTPHRFLTFENGTYTILTAATTSYSIGQIIPGFADNGEVLVFDQAKNQVSTYELDTGKELTFFPIETDGTFKQVASVYGYRDEHPLNSYGYSMFNQFIKL